jgi:hypothetical protein
MNRLPSHNCRGAVWRGRRRRPIPAAIRKQQRRSIAVRSTRAFLESHRRRSRSRAAATPVETSSCHSRRRQATVVCLPDVERGRQTAPANAETTTSLVRTSSKFLSEMSAPSTPVRLTCLSCAYLWLFLTVCSCRGSCCCKCGRLSRQCRFCRQPIFVHF